MAAPDTKFVKYRISGPLNQESHTPMKSLTMPRGPMSFCAARPGERHAEVEPTTHFPAFVDIHGILPLCQLHHRVVLRFSIIEVIHGISLIYPVVWNFPAAYASLGKLSFHMRPKSRYTRLRHSRRVGQCRYEGLPRTPDTVGKQRSTSDAEQRSQYHHCRCRHPYGACS